MKRLWNAALSRNTPVKMLDNVALLPNLQNCAMYQRMLSEMVELAERITIDPEQCGGRPCIRGMRIRVSDVLDLLANGLTIEQIVEELPDLEEEDIRACLRFASHRLHHPVLAA